MKALLQRKGNGFGDWLFMLHAMRHVNLQHPDVELYVDFELPPIGRRPLTLPTIARQAFESSDVIYKHPTSGVRFDVELRHVVYPRHVKTPYLVGVLEQLTASLGRELVPRVEHRPRFVYPECSSRPTENYFVMVGHGRGETKHKDWGIAKAEKLGHRIYHELGATVVQIGATGDVRMRGFPCEGYYGATFDMVAGLLAGAVGFVGLENGLAVLTGLLDVAHVVTYTSPKEIGRLESPKLIAEVNPTVDQVFQHCEGILDAHRSVSLRTV